MAFNKFSNMDKKRSKIDESELEKPKLLIIDDDPNVCQTLEFMLKNKYNVTLCNSGKEGIEVVDQSVFVVILDIKMPGKNGLEVYEEIKRKIPNLPIIFYSAFQNLLESSRLRQQYKPFGYFNKDGSFEGLSDCIEKAIKQYDQLCKLAKITDQLKSTRKRPTTH